MIRSFTDEQLGALLESVVDSYLEYSEVHGQGKQVAKWSAIREVSEGLEGEDELVRDGVIAGPSDQTYLVEPETPALADVRLPELTYDIHALTRKPTGEWVLELYVHVTAVLPGGRVVGFRRTVFVDGEEHGWRPLPPPPPEAPAQSGEGSDDY